MIRPISKTGSLSNTAFAEKILVLGEAFLFAWDCMPVLSGEACAGLIRPMGYAPSFILRLPW